LREYAQEKESIIIEKTKLLKQIKSEKLDQETWEFVQIKERFCFRGIRAQERYETIYR